MVHNKHLINAIALILNRILNPLAVKEGGPVSSWHFYGVGTVLSKNLLLHLLPIFPSHAEK